MKVIYTDRARQSAEGYALLQNATAQLEQIATPTARFVTATWDRRSGVDEKSRPVHTLRLSWHFAELCRGPLHGRRAEGSQPGALAFCWTLG